jgi:crossover junction endodeoxyribonuclease RusA
MSTVKQIMALPFTVIAPWPPHTLSPNARIHWRRLAVFKADYKRNCMAHFQGQGLRNMKLAEGEILNVTMMFTPPVSREHDADNLVSRAKYALDALKDVIRHDDKHFRIMPVLIDAPSRSYAGITITVERAGE